MRKLGGAAVVAASAAIAACYSLNLSSTTDAMAIGGPATLVDNGGLNYSYDFGTQTGPTPFVMFEFLPAGNDYYVDMMTGSGACNLFPIMAGSPPLDGSSGSTLVYNDPTGTCTASMLRGATPQFGDCPYNFGVQFIPQNGSASCTYTFHYTLKDMSSQGNIVLNLDGNGNVQGISASPSMLSFSTPVMVTSGADTATVTNLGSGSATGSAYVTDTTHFMVSGPQPWTLNGTGSSQDYSVTCNSNTAGTYVANLVFQPATGNPASIPLSCDVQNTNGLTFTGSPVNFPLTAVGAAAMNQPLTAYYSGSAQPISFTLDGSASTTGVTMVPVSGYSTMIGSGTTNGSAVSVTMHWTPTAVTSGKLGTLQVVFGMTGSAITFPVQINGQSDVANVATNPTGVDFGAICAGSVPPKMFSVYNTGGVDAMLSNISPPTSGFTLTPSYMNQTIAHGHGNDLAVTVNVAATTEGELMGLATLNLVGNPNVQVQLHATVVGAGVTTTPGALAFGTTIVGGTSNRQSFALANCGAGDLVIMAASITDDSNGTPSNDFRVASPSPIEGTTVAMTKSQTIQMEMTPQTSGHKTATLTLLLSSGESRTIALDGSGGGPPPIGSGSGSGKDRETYYACSTGRPLAFVPIGLVVAWLARRRRRR